MLAFSILYYRVAEAENRSGIVWGGFSALAYGLAFFLNTGLIGMLLGQALVYIVMWGINCFRPLSDI
jgi:hypothetical protein